MVLSINIYPNTYGKIIEQNCSKQMQFTLEYLVHMPISEKHFAVVVVNHFRSYLKKKDLAFDQRHLYVNYATIVIHKIISPLQV